IRASAPQRGQRFSRRVRNSLMNLKLGPALLGAVVGVVLLPAGASAAYCGACAYPVQPCNPEQCCLPVVRYRICYRTVVEEQKCVSYRPTYHTVLKECHYITVRPVYEQHWKECRSTTLRPVWEEYEVPHKYTVYRPCYEQHVRCVPYTVCRPVFQEYQVPVRY